MKRSTKLVLAGGALVVIVGGCSAVLSSSNNSATNPPPVAAASAAPSSEPSSDIGGMPSDSATPAQAETDKVTFVVTGSPADVTYGPAGSSFSGTVPMHKTMKIPSDPPSYYSVTAQLSGGGEVSCKILVNGKVISTGRATGGYNIALCEIVQGFSGGWEHT